jgi:hypothetical protein
MVLHNKPGEGETLALIRRLRRKPRGGERLSYDAIAARLLQNPRRRWRNRVPRGIHRAGVQIPSGMLAFCKGFSIRKCHPVPP